MRINENIFKGKGNFLDNDYRNYYSTKIIKIENKILYGKVDNTALFYINIDTSGFIEERWTISADIYNAGNVPLYVEMYSLALPFSPKLVNPGEKFKLENSTYTTNESISLRIACKESGDLGFYCRNIKIEKGDNATPYIPSKNMLEPSKQPLLPPEGNYKEIQALQESLGSIF